MRHSYNISIIIATLIFTSACSNSYIHNTVKTPVFVDSTKAELSFSLGSRHAELNLAYSYHKNLFFIMSSYVGTKRYDIFARDNQLMADAGMGARFNLGRNTYLGGYLTGGYGHSKYNRFVYGSANQNINAYYQRVAVTSYIKNVGETSSFYLGVRTSYVNFPTQYRYKYKSFTSRSFFSSHTTINQIGPYKTQGYADILAEAVIGVDIKLGKRVNYFIQNTFAVPILRGDTKGTYTDAFDNNRNADVYSKLNTYNISSLKMGLDFMIR